MVLRTARFLTHNHAEADDLAQETLVKAFKAISQFDTATNAKGWLSAILRNSWIDQLRASGRHAPIMSLNGEQHDPADESAPEHLSDTGDPVALLEQFSDAQMIGALREIPEEIRWTLLLVDVESLDHAQAAEILQIPEGTVKSRAYRGRRMLREKLGKTRPSRETRVSSVEDTP